MSSQSQVTFTIPASLKSQALKKAKLKGITLKALYTSFTEDFINGKVSMNLQYHPKPEMEILDVTPEMQKDINEIGSLLSRKRGK